uniref:Uncharacterized protein n=1 Tax=Arundo donax TaxID=35708 RepID=A0A0A9CHP9_ARUDO
MVEKKREKRTRHRRQRTRRR